MTNAKINTKLGIAAALVLILSFSLLAHNELSKEETETITVNGKQYDWNKIYGEFPTTNIDSHEGILLSEIINDTGLKNPSNHEYKITASDGYQKTVSWSNMRNGLLVKKDKRVVFPELAKAFWVENVVKIEVI